MAQQTINVGTIANDGTGDPIRTAMIKIQNNFSEFYSALTPTLSTNNVVASNNMTVTANLYTNALASNNITVTANLYVNTISTPFGSNANLIIDPDGSADVIFTNQTEVLVYSNVQSTNVSTGALVVNGGIGVANSVVVGNNIFVTNGINAASYAVGTSTVANSSGVYANVVNAATLSVGTTTVSNSSGIFTTVINATSSVYVGSNVVINTSALFIGNSTVNSVVGYQNTSGTTTFSQISGIANASVDSVVVNYGNTLATNASSDFAAYDSHGSNSYNFIDMGISGSAFSQSFWTIGGASDGYLYTGNTNLSIGTANNGFVNFFTNGTLITNERMRITPTGNIGINNTAPVHTLSVNGNSYFGANVTSIATINAFALTVGSVVVANASVFNANGIASNSTGLYVTGTVNAASYSIGATFTANSTLIGAAAINITGQVNTATFYASTSANVGTYVIANSSGLTVNGNSIVTNVFSVGNSTVNTFSNSTHFFSGNSTYYGYGNSTFDVLVSPTGNVYISPISVVISNASANVFIANTTGTFVNSNMTVSTNTITLGTSNVAHTAALANGYSRITNGLLMQWGTATVNSTAQIVTFATSTGAAFTTNCFSLSATTNAAGGTYTPAVYSINATAFTIITANTANALITWTAIGI